MAFGKSKNNRLDNEINASSMADIAFLLLIFFLVTTTIEADKGIRVVLPPWSDEPPDILQFEKRNVYSVLINASNQLLVRSEPMSVEDLKDNAKEFIMNPGNRDDLAISPQEAIISLKNDRGTEYKTYIEVYDQLKAAYTELRDDRAMAKYGKEYAFCTFDQRRVIRDEIPLNFSEAEPTSFGKE